jgi:4-alpha-glucanotransferase
MDRPQLDAFGISDHYFDIFGARRETPEATRHSLRASMGAEPSGGEPPVRVVRRGEAVHGLCGELSLESGGNVRLDGAALPPDLPLGYHRLQPPDAAPLELIVAPPRCWLPDELRSWGWAAQLYALRSSRSWGMGDLGDLRSLAGYARQLGAELLLINPLPAVAPIPEQQASPYYPSSRCFRNPLYLRVEDVPGAAALGEELSSLAAAGRALNAQDLIDHRAVYQLKMQALDGLFAHFSGDARFERFCEEQGELLAGFARYCVLAERHGADWRRWPEELRRPGNEASKRAAAGPRQRFFQWLQWLLDEQVASASEDILLIHDLPIGVDPGGADAWLWQDVMALDVSVGAPPDRYSADGQCWGLPPFIPHKLRAAGFEPFARTLRATLRHSEGLRIDHVMGLFRLFWIPCGRSAADGAYVYYPADDLLAITALESQRAGAVIVGEDLGTVEPGTREKLAAHAILSYRVLWFEQRPPADYPELALAAVTTHDLPTIAGLWSGSELDEQRALGLRVDEAEDQRVRAHLGEVSGVDERAPIAEVIEATYRALGHAPSRLLTATLEDAAGALRRPNVPATNDDQRPNWRVPLPMTLEELMQSPLPRRIAEALARR